MAYSILALGQDFTFDKEKGKAIPSFIGQVKLIKGNVFKRSADASLTSVKTGERFKVSEGVVTKEQSFLKIELIDETIISIGSNTEIKFNEYEFTDKENRSFLFSLIRGQMTGNIKNKAASDQLRFKTKFTTMGIRGTYILMNTQNKNSLEVSQFALLSGNAAMTSGKEKLDLAKGDHLIVVSGESITDQEKISLSEDEMKKLSAENIDDTNDFKPFLPFIDITNNSIDLLRKHFQKYSPNASGEVVLTKREDKKSSWQQNLKKLNQKLKENHQKKR
jgi:hypothetical protein